MMEARSRKAKESYSAIRTTSSQTDGRLSSPQPICPQRHSLCARPDESYIKSSPTKSNQIKSISSIAPILMVSIHKLLYLMHNHKVSMSRELTTNCTRRPPTHDRDDALREVAICRQTFEPSQLHSILRTASHARLSQGDR
jgi:hypothetical protein